MLTLTRAWSRTQKVRLVASTVLAIGAFVAFACSYKRSHRLPDESILFGTWQMTTPHNDYILCLHDIVGLWDGVRRDHWHSGMWIHDDPAKQLEGYSEMGWYAGGSNIYMRFVEDPMPQIWEIMDISLKSFVYGIQSKIMYSGALAMNNASNHAMERTADRPYA